MTKNSAKKTVGAAGVGTATGVLPEVAPPRTMPPFKVILHNDDVNTIEHVITTIIWLTALKREDAIERTFEADRTGCALLLVTHRERAELYQEQFASAGLTVTIEPDA